MHMWIWWGHEFGDFMIYGLKVNTVGGLVATCFFCAGLAIFFEYLKLLQAQHRSRQLYYRTQQIRNICPPENTQLLNDREISTVKRISLPLIDIMLWIFTFNLGYLMMLTVMLYNGWIFISVILGSGLGYFIFGQKFMKINLQNCQMIRSSFCMKDCDNPEFQKYYDLTRKLPLGYNDKIISELEAWDTKVNEIHAEYKELEAGISKKTNENELSEEFKDFSAQHFKKLYDTCDIIRCYIVQLRVDKEYEDYNRKNMERRMRRFDEILFEKFHNKN